MGGEVEYQRISVSFDAHSQSHEKRLFTFGDISKQRGRCS